MRRYNEIFNINSTVLPFAPDQLNALVKATVSSGYVACNYNNLITTIHDINKSTEYDITLNASEIAQINADPTKNINVIIQVEGDRINNLYQYHIANIDDDSLCTFDSYSAEFKSEIYELKAKLAHKILDTYENISAWAVDENVSIADDTIRMMCNDFDMFKQYILNTNDIEGFVKSLSDEVLSKYMSELTKNGIKILQKYKTEVLDHFKNISKLETSIKIKNPVIVRIYVVSNLVAKCKVEWPQLDVIGLDRHSFESLSMYV